MATNDKFEQILSSINNTELKINLENLFNILGVGRGDSAGDVTLVGNVSGDVSLNSGIKFPATQVPSSDVNVLDDYEEGTFTPIPADADTGGNQGSANNQVGRYVKVGRKVTCTIWLDQIVTVGLTPTNTFYIQGLPFTVSNLQFSGAVTTSLINYTGTLTVFPTIPSNSVTFFQNVSGAAFSNLLVSGVTSGSGSLITTFDYFV